MGTDVHVVVVDGDRSLPHRAQERIEALERRWSRFLPDSEIERAESRRGTGRARLGRDA